MFEILRPIGPGSLTEIDTQYPTSGEHWDKVDEAYPDEETTYVENKNGAAGVYQTDLYDIAAPSASGTIKSVSVYMLTKHNASAAKAVIKTHGTVYESSEGGGPAWQRRKYKWTTNPFTGLPWTWEEVADMEAGVALKGSTASPDWSRGTQLYVEVDYDIYPPTAFERQVSANDDDCMVYNQSGWKFTKTETYYQVGRINSVYGYGAGLRFQNVLIPQGATIARAYLKLVSSEDKNPAAIVKSVIIGEAADNATAFSTLEDYQARRGTVVGGPNDDHITSNYTLWDYLEGWYAGYQYESLDISAVIQEIVDRPGWESGNSLVLFWDDHANRSTSYTNNYRRAYGYGGSPANAPVLHVEYFIILPPTVTTDPATNVKQRSARLNGTLVDDGGGACDCGFEWGETPAYGNITPTQSRTSGETFAQTITNLVPGKTYHFRAFATNSVGTEYGADRMFTTLRGMVGLNPALELLLD